MYLHHTSEKYSPSTPWAINILFKSIKGVFPIKSDGLEDARFRVYKDEKEVIATINVSACGLQKQSHKGKLRSNEVAKQPRLHMEHYEFTS